MGVETSIEEILKNLVEKFNKKVDEDKDLYERIKDLNRRIKLKIQPEGIFYGELKDGKITELKKVSEDVEADISVETSRDVFLQLISQQLSPFIAYMNGLVRIKAPLKDLLLLKNLFGSF